MEPAPQMPTTITVKLSSERLTDLLGSFSTHLSIRMDVLPTDSFGWIVQTAINKFVTEANSVQEYTIKNQLVAILQTSNWHVHVGSVQQLIDSHAELWLCDVPHTLAFNGAW